MKKSFCLIKAFLISLLLLSVISCGDNSVMYQLTLDGNGATEHKMPVVYYNASNGKWYSDVGVASSVTKVTVPQRQFTLKYDYGNVSTLETVAERKASYDFSSYPGYTDSQGNILNSVVLKSNAITQAEWKTAGKGFSIALPSASPKATGKIFVGWKKYENDEYIYAPGAKVTINESEIIDNSFTMIAVWESSDEVVLRVKYDSEDSGKVYTYKRESRGWYSSENKVDKVTIPEKKISVTFMPNQPGISAVPGGVQQDSTFPFNGYKDTTNDKVYILSSGNFASIADEDYGKTIEVLASWGEQKPIVLPTLEKNGFKFLGWNLSGKESEDYNAPGFEYKPDEESKGDTLKGVWRSNDVYSLDLDGDGATSSAVEKIYYRIDGGWYSNEEGTSEIKDIIVPEKVWTITYDSNIREGEGDSVPIPESRTEIEFEGFEDETTREIAISKDGTINTNYKINENKNAIAKWKYTPIEDDTSGVLNETTTLKINAPKNLVRENFTLLGWSEDKDATSPTYIETIDYKANEMTLYAIWSDDRVWTLNVNNVQSKSTTDMGAKKYYYAPGTGKWYRTSNVNGDAITQVDEDDMKRTYKISFESNLDGVPGLESRDYEYTFGGAKIEIGEESIEIIGDDGTLKSLPQDKLNVDLIWNGEDIDVSKDAIEITQEGYTHLGWSLTPNGEIIETLSPLEQNVVLYAIWQDDHIYKLTLSPNGATNAPDKEVFFKVSEGKWYSKETCAEEEVIEDITPPEKEWIATFDLNYPSSDDNLKPDSLTSTWTFKGYSPYIDENGNFSSTKLTSDFTVKAMWGEQTPIQMPIVSRDHYIFMGWNKSGTEGDINDPGRNGSYIITSDDLEGGTSEVAFKAIWKSEVYKLTLDDDGATTPSCGSVYYVYDKGWYLDEKGTNPIEAISIPKKEYSVRFLPYLGSSSLQDLTSTLPFNGYSAKTEDGTMETYITNDGAIQGKLASSVVAKATWGGASEVEIPYQAKRDGYVFDKWVRVNENGESEIIETPYTPKENGELIEGIWIDATSFGDEAFVFENDAYVFDPSQITTIVEGTNYALPSTFDDRISEGNDTFDANSSEHGVHKVIGFKAGSRFKKEAEVSLLTSINIPSTITSIPDELFSECNHLVSVVIPSTCVSIGNDAFRGCTSLKKIEFGGTTKEWENVLKGGGWNTDVGTIDVVCSDGKIQVKESGANNTIVEKEDPEQI